jgi:capsid protein
VNRFLSFFGNIAQRAKKAVTLSGKVGNRFPVQGKRAGFDMAAENRHTENHYSDASNGDINVIISNDRATMQKRTRYEVRNNCILRGIRNSFVNEIIGTGPSLQMQTGVKRFDSMVENRWREYVTNKDLCDAGKRHDYAWILRTGLKDTSTMGEDLTTFRTVNRTGVQMAIQPINPLRLGTPITSFNNPDIYDGVRVDPTTTAPIDYFILKHHPGGNQATNDYEVISAQQIIHYFMDDESEQFRGYPLLAPALPLASALRRYTMAVVAAAEQAANISGVVTSTLPNVDPDLIDAMDELEIARNSLLTMPVGYDVKQFKAEQPTSTYATFKMELVNEIGRCLFMPYIVAGGNAQGYNYSSGRLDLQDWWKATELIRQTQETAKVEPTFQRWFAEARLIPLAGT